MLIIVPSVALAAVTSYIICYSRLASFERTLRVFERQIAKARYREEQEERILSEIFSVLSSLQTNTEEVLHHMGDKLNQLAAQIQLDHGSPLLLNLSDVVTLHRSVDGENGST
jgi:hypothetical protein